MKKKIMITIDEELFAEVEKRRKIDRMSRSGYFEFCINRELKKYKRFQLVNDVSTAMGALDMYIDDLDDETKEEIANVLEREKRKLK